MQTFAYILVSFILIIIVYQDFKYKAVSWVIFPVLLIPPLYLGFVQVGWERLWICFVTNFGFLFIQFFLLTIYISIKNKKLTDLTKGYLGLGDILFLLVLCLFFSPVNYIVFYLFSLIIILAVYLLYNIFKRSKQRTLFKQQIPLAGSIAIVLIILVVYKLVVSRIEFYTDILP